MKKDWYQQKTTWAGIGGLVAALSGYFTGTMVAPEAIQLGVLSLMGIFLRQGVERNKP